MSNLRGQKKSWKSQSFLLDFFCPIESHFFVSSKKLIFFFENPIFWGGKKYRHYVLLLFHLN